MANPRIYEVEKHYLVSADYSSNVTRNWDVYIASSGEEYYGKAIVEDGKRIIPWTKLKNEELSPLDEMLTIMKTAYEN
ncbi:hypothetical protein [Metabacillus halosaccharovorans]|uniref:Uncharacterized protein n=1 Tax=Metabacillus halosaccharovorans TaxID=930124 RepID=A0ABT3DCB7_9BACI|nr:hypothetical protein [Metabacillus halosaccharovorans]MCV9884713.1 hypothetical protein [Metabacillus halosaccharovorans]